MYAVRERKRIGEFRSDILLSRCQPNCHWLELQTNDNIAGSFDGPGSKTPTGRVDRTVSWVGSCNGLLAPRYLPCACHHLSSPKCYGFCLSGGLMNTLGVAGRRDQPDGWADNTDGQERKEKRKEKLEAAVTPKCWFESTNHQPWRLWMVPEGRKRERERARRRAILNRAKRGLDECHVQRCHQCAISKL